MNLYLFFALTWGKKTKQKQFIPKRTSNHHSFERYMKQFLPHFSWKKMIY